MSLSVRLFPVHKSTCLHNWARAQYLPLKKKQELWPSLRYLFPVATRTVVFPAAPKSNVSQENIRTHHRTSHYDGSRSHHTCHLAVWPAKWHHRVHRSTELQIHVLSSQTSRGTQESSMEPQDRPRAAATTAAHSTERTRGEWATPGKFLRGERKWRPQGKNCLEFLH